MAIMRRTSSSAGTAVGSGGAERPLPLRGPCVRPAGAPLAHIHRRVTLAPSPNALFTQRIPQEAPKLDLPPGKYGLPFLGETLEFMKDPLSFCEDRTMQYGSIFKSHILFQPAVFISKDSSIRKILNSEHKLVESAWPRQYQELLGDAFTGGKKRHQSHRNIIGVAFGQEAISNFAPTLEELVKRRLAPLASQTDGFSAYNQMKVLALEVATLMLTGLSINDSGVTYIQEQFATYVKGFRIQFPVALPWTDFGKALKAKEKIMKELDKHLKQIADAKASGNHRPSDKRAPALEVFMEAKDDEGVQVSEQNIKDMLLFTIFAGHETTGTTMSQIMRTLQLHPQALQSLREEQKRIVERYGPELTGDVLSRMPYTDAIIKEAMRLRWVVGMVWRNACRDFELEGYRIPEGHRIICSMASAAESIPEFQADKDDFRPERWLESKETLKKNPEGYMPFGAGARICLGMPLAIAELRCFLAVLAREYEWKLERPEDPWVMGQPTDGLAAKMWRLNSQST